MATNNWINGLIGNHATNESNNSFIKTTVFTNSLFNNMSTNMTIKPQKSCCNCDKDFVEYFCKVQAISHSECLATKQVRCLLCSAATDFKSIQWHIVSEKHKLRHKQLMEYVFLLSIPIYNPPQAMKISNVLENIYKKCYLDDVDRQRRQQVIDTIILLMQTNGLSDYTLRLYGSTINGFGLKDSDINLDIVPIHPPTETTDKSGKNVESVAIVLSKISNIIKRKTQLFSNVRNEYNLKVPKIRFNDRRFNFEIEISITVNKSYRSSKLLQQYCQIDRRVGILGTAFREWARIYGFDDQENGLWPAPAFPIMTIHFLQRCNPPVLPCLHELFPNPIPTQKETKSSPNEENDSHEDDFDLSLLKWNTTNNKTVGQLWLEMLRYYSAQFDTETYVVSIRTTRSPFMRSDKHWMSRMLAVEDPTRPSLNLSRSVGSMRLYNIFVEQLRNTFKYFAIPFIKISSNNNPNTKINPLFTERDFEIVVNQTDYYNSFDFNDLLSQINEIETGSEQKNSKGSDDSDSEDENKRNDTNFHSKIIKVLRTFGIRMILTPELESTLCLMPVDQFYYDFCFNRMIFFERPPKFCRLCHRYSHLQVNCPENELPHLIRAPLSFDPNYITLLNEVCYQIFKDKRIEERDEFTHKSILNDLECFIRKHMSNARLELFGSTKSGFGARNCDLDICLTFDDNPNRRGIRVRENH